MMFPKTTRHRPILRGDNFLRDVLQEYQLDIDADRHNIEPAREDIQFVVGDQWDPAVRKRRDRLKKPSLTINRLPAFVAQYIGAWLQNEVAPKLTPVAGGSRRVAEIRQGLIRSVMRETQAKDALKRAMMTSYISGIGAFKLALRDAEGDVFKADMCVEAIDDPLGVVWDRASREPTGSDARHCFVPVWMTRRDFDAAYPGHEHDGGWPYDDNDVHADMTFGPEDFVKVVEFWQMRHEKVTVGLEAASGDVIVLDGMDEAEIAMRVQIDLDGSPMIRETTRPYAECYILTAQSVLEGPYRLDCPRLPVFRVEGWTLWEVNTRHRWGFVRHARDPQRLHNYFRSVQAEYVTKSVAGKWQIDEAGGANQVQKFRDAVHDDDSVLTWNSQGGGQPPVQLPPLVPDRQVMLEAAATVQDIKDVTNKHEASLGVQSNERSGKAITARQRVSELGDVIHIEHMNAAVAELARAMNALIPTVYDTWRTVKVTGADDEETLQEINGDMGDATPDITKGKYAITYTTGPSYATKRQEAVEMISTLMNTMPNVASGMADILFRNMDIPGAEELEERAASMLPPGLINVDRLPEAKKQAVLARQAQQEQEQKRQQMLQMAQFAREMAKLEAETAELRGRAARHMADAGLAESQIGADMIKAVAAAYGVEVDAMQAQIGAAGLATQVFTTGFAAALADKVPDAQATPQQETTDGGDAGAA